MSMKALQSVKIACLLCAALLPAVVDAQFTFTTNTDGSLNIYNYTGTNNIVSLVIPAITNGLPVTTIGEPQAPPGVGIFASLTSLQNVTFNTNLVAIGQEMFAGDHALTNVTLPDSVQNIGLAAFQACGLVNATIGNGVTNIGDQAFQNCGSLVSITIGTNVTSIGFETFYRCSNLASLTIPSVSSLGVFPFEGCVGLTNVVLGNGLTSIGSGLFVGCTNLPDIIIPNGVTNIGDSAFGNCHSLSSVTIGTNVTTIGFEAFYGCTDLTNIVIPGSVTNIGDEAFAYCNLEGIYFEGNPPAPDNDAGVFQGDNNQATAYYLPGNTNWGSTFDGIPTVLWNPQAQTSDGSFGVLNNQFGFDITGTTNIPIVVEASTNLLNSVWTQLQSCLVTNGSIYFSDLQWTNYPDRFYRIRSP